MPTERSDDRHDAPHGIVQVAVPAPLRRVFDYQSTEKIRLGARVRVPFGRREVIGVVVSHQPAASARRLKRVLAALDDESVFGEKLLSLLVWAAHYYHHPLGEVMQTALPTALRKGAALSDPTRSRFARALENPAAADLLKRAPQQARLHQHLLGAGWVDAGALGKAFPQSHDALRRLQQKNLLEVVWRSTLPAAAADESTIESAAKSTVQLNPEQQTATDAIAACAGGFGSFLLRGVTGSGKTEVYLEAAERCAAAGKQTLILVPEIALTPQLIARFRARLGDGVCALHSALSAEKRYRAWWLAREGHAVVVLGTRSAVFTPLKFPGMIVVDEEHDISYKQQDGFRYHARDLAIKRASLENIPVTLGSATPSMETRHNARPGRHRLLTLGTRAGGAELPRIGFIDLKQHRPLDGVSSPLLQAIKQRLQRGEQCIVFLNRRGFAPTAMCHGCGWQATCRRCDARLTYHRDREQFQCHYCGHASAVRMACAECGQRLGLIGVGTQRLERHLREKFPEARISRLDRDQVTTQAQLELELEAIRLGRTDIIIGTQLIAKGHDFPNVTLVGVVNSDQGLYSIDFRAAEYLFQRLTQVSGRAGRATAKGEVLIQTAHPQHRALQDMRRHDVDGFAGRCLAERRAANYPPFSHIALWRAESTQQAAALKFLRHTAGVGKRLLAESRLEQVRIMDAVASPMEKLAGRHRAQLLVRSDHRGQLHQLLAGWLASTENDPQSKLARWSIDVDPMEMF